MPAIGQLDRHLIEAPAGAQQHHQRDGGRVELLAAVHHGRAVSLARPLAGATVFCDGARCLRY
jgi:hypothetical protein